MYCKMILPRTSAKQLVGARHHGSNFRLPLTPILAHNSCRSQKSAFFTLFTLHGQAAGMRVHVVSSTSEVAAISVTRTGELLLQNCATQQSTAYQPRHTAQ
jgi:hypothetical protein